MREQRVVLLLGASLFVAGVEASLRAHSELVVVQIDEPFSNVQGQIADLRPDVIVFDSGESSLDGAPSLVQLLKQSPNIPIIGIDLDANSEITVFSTQHRRVIKAEDLVQAIQSLTSRGQD
ncbi:MAG: hypothetical protein H3C34_23715 [Caldilineaceae bacterium]|nr:hypothetical protein [Caldilineaceae bacterium]